MLVRWVSYIEIDTIEYQQTENIETEVRAQSKEV